MMTGVLLVSQSEKYDVVLSRLLRAAHFSSLTIARSCAEARQRMINQQFDVVLLNAPLQDESGEELAKSVVAIGSSQAILIVSNEYYDAIVSATEEYGVLVLAKPFTREALFSLLHFTRATHNRLHQLQETNKKLSKSLDDMRVINRAKVLLITEQHISEETAHRLIERTAMDRRITKREVAKEIIARYET